MRKHPRSIAGWLLGLAATTLIAADQPQKTIPEPGFRPNDYCNPGFTESLDTSTIAVLPTIIRRAERTAHSFDSQKQIVTFLNEMGLAATSTHRRVDLGPARRTSQWEMFKYAARSVTETLRDYDTGTDFILVMELLVPDSQAVFGIELYLVDQDGEHELSFLLNEHHEMFAEAGLVAKNSSEEARQAMISRATEVGLAALDQQITQLRECVADDVYTPRLTDSGVLHDFRMELRSGTDKYGIPLGFSTFGDDKSTVKVALTDRAPPRPGASADNSALRLDVDINGWGGFINLFANDAMDTWIAEDWSQVEGFSFWLHGNGSGSRMYVHIMDNRHPCSRRDDAERFGIDFWDDVAGWRLIRVAFEDTERKEVNNGAPNDGLNLTAVHGWGLGLMATNGPNTFFIDDFRLWRASEMPPGEAHEKISHRLFEEQRLDDTTSMIMLRTGDMRGLVVEKVMDLSCEIARLTRDRGFRYYLTDDRAALSGGRHRLRLTFFESVPEGVAVVDVTDPRSEKETPDVMTAAVDTDTMVTICGIVTGERKWQ